MNFAHSVCPNAAQAFGANPHRPEPISAIPPISAPPEIAEIAEIAQERFVWDYWHVPEQYTLVRTAAAPYFGEVLALYSPTPIATREAERCG